jgi:pentose-5-phosphate-3-epimerase
MTRVLSAHAAAVGVSLAGSVIALPHPRRIGLAQSLTASGHWVHADRIEGSYRGQPGVSVAEVHDLARIPDVRLDVHLMVDEPIAELHQLPLLGISRITVQSDGLDDLREVVSTSRNYAEQVWLAVHHASVDADRLEDSGADGLLVMLTPPGQPGHRADLAQLMLVTPIHSNGLSAGVDGGVTDANLDRIAASGARYAVVGRALTSNGNR